MYSKPCTALRVKRGMSFSLTKPSFGLLLCPAQYFTLFASVIRSIALRSLLPTLHRYGPQCLHTVATSLCGHVPISHTYCSLGSILTHSVAQTMKHMRSSPAANICPPPAVSPCPGLCTMASTSFQPNTMVSQTFSIKDATHHSLY